MVSTVRLEGGLDRPARKDPRLLDREDEHEAFKFFKAWEQNLPKPLAKSSLAHYRSVWRTWVKYAEGKQIEWRTPTKEQILDFLSQLQPRYNTRKRGGEALDHTKLRYASVLRRVFVIDEDLVEQAHKLGRSQLASENLLDQPEATEIESLVLHSAAWAHVLGKVARLDKEISSPATCREPAAKRRSRDRAMLTLMCHDGMTVQELSLLSVADVTAHKVGESTLVSLRIRANTKVRSAKERTVVLSKVSSATLKHWMDVRRIHLKEQLAPEFARVFLGLSRNKGREVRPLLADGFYEVVRSFMPSALVGSGLQASQLMHIGPNLLRNCYLARCIENGEALDEISQRMGLRDTRPLKRIERWVLLKKAG